MKKKTPVGSTSEGNHGLSTSVWRNAVIYPWIPKETSPDAKDTVLHFLVAQVDLTLGIVGILAP